MINLSKAAAKEIRRLQVTRDRPNSRLRIKVETGGCSELFYFLDFDETIHSSATSGDHIYESHGISVIVDQQSYDYLSGLKLDYSEDLMGGSFRFHNPNASVTCSCGHSFSVSP